MLSFLLLASASGQPLPSDAVARCSLLPSRELVFVPTASTTWRSADGHVVLAAWSDRPGGWHLGGHGATLTTGTPWPLASRFDAPSGVAFELTDRLGADPSALSWLTGATTIVRVLPDGTGFVGTPPSGGGAVHVAHGDGVVAISDRAGLAATGAGLGARRTDLPAMLRGGLTGGDTAIGGVDRLLPGSHVQLRGRVGAKTVEGPTSWHEVLSADADLDELVAAASDDLVRLVEMASSVDGPRTLDLGADPGSRVLTAALAATGTAGRFTVRPRASAVDQAAAAAFAAHLDVTPEDDAVHVVGGEALDARVRTAVARLEGSFTPSLLVGGPLAGLSDTRGLVLSATPGGPLSPGAGATGRRLLTSQAWSTLEAADAAWVSGRGRAATDAHARAVLAEVDRWAPRRQRAAADLAGAASRLDPTAITSVARVALAAAARGADPTALLVAALHGPTATVMSEAPPEPDASITAWRSLAPVLEAHVLGHGREALQDVLDMDEVAMVVRAGLVPDADTMRALEGALALAVWAAGTDTHRPSAPAPVELRSDLAAWDQVPTLVTGVTSRSLIELSDLSVPLDAIEDDALLGVPVDREVRDLVQEILLAVGATPGHLPADLDSRLSGPATASLAGPARTLLARRGGTLADARLALTLPFWRAHVAPPRVVLVAERPPDLAMRTTAQLPISDLLGWWVDAMAATAASGVDVRIVDPGDLMDLEEEEATGWDGLADGQTDGDLVRVVRTVDSLVREVELEAARPLLRTIRMARAESTSPDQMRAAAPAAAPLHVVDELWERAVEADRRLGEQRVAAEGLEAKMTALQDELTQLRGRKGFKAAWQTFRGVDA